MAQRQLQRGRPNYVFSFDARKAFDTAPHGALHLILRHLSVPPDVIDLLLFLTSTAGHTRGHSAPGDNGGGPPRRLQPAPQRGKDTNNPSLLTQNHKQPPGAAAQPAEPGPNPERRGAEPTVYKAHPTHGAGTRPHRTQLRTAARKTTLNAGQCVRQPREGRGRNRQAPPPQKKRRGEGEKARRQPTAAKPPANTTTGGQAPTPEGTEKRTPTEAQGDHPPKTGNTKPVTADHGEKGQGKKKKKKESHQPSPKERGWRDRDHKARKKKKKKRKNRSAKNTPRQPSQKGLGTGEIRAQHTRPHGTPEPETAGGKQGAHETTHVPQAGLNRSPTTNTTNSRH